jgi:tol-pal system protein YbgF
MPTGSRLVAYLFLPFFLFGCSANDLVVKRQVEADAKIEFLIQSSKKAEQRHNELSGLLQVQEERLQSVTVELKRLKGESREMQSSQDELKSRVATLSKQLQTPKVEIVNQLSPVNTTRDSGPPVEYLKAFGLYSANNFPAAIESFESFLKYNPQSDYAANAVYWIGECHYTLSNFAKAIDAFSKVSESYPKSTKVPDALLKLGYSLSATKEKEKATGVFERIITSYPSSSAAVKARERLNEH